MRREHQPHSPSRPQCDGRSRTWVTRCALAGSLAAVLPQGARADGVAEELSAGATGSAGSRWVSNQLAGMWDADPAWHLRLDLSATRAAGESAGDTYVRDRFFQFTSAGSAGLGVQYTW